MLEQKIRARSKVKPVLLMAHTVLGYPCLDKSLEMIKVLDGAGADILELQIPFSDPVADGPVICRANEEAILRGASISGCLDLIQEAAEVVKGPVIVMAYYNTVYCHGVARFAETLARYGAAGVLVPDLPPEEGACHLESLRSNGLAPILTLSPGTPMNRMERMSTLGGGFIYCVARRGVTGQATRFGPDVSSYLLRCRQASTLPLAAGFGVSSRKDVEFLQGRVEIAVIGTELMRRMEAGGPGAAGDFLVSLMGPAPAPAGLLP